MFSKIETKVSKEKLMAITSKKNGINPGVTFYKIDANVCGVWITNLTVQAFPDFLGLERHIYLGNPFFRQGVNHCMDNGWRTGYRSNFSGSLGPKGLVRHGAFSKRLPEREGISSALGKA